MASECDNVYDINSFGEYNEFSFKKFKVKSLFILMGILPRKMSFISVVKFRNRKVFKAYLKNRELDNLPCQLVNYNTKDEDLDNRNILGVRFSPLSNFMIITFGNASSKTNKKEKLFCVNPLYENFDFQAETYSNIVFSQNDDLIVDLNGTRSFFYFYDSEKANFKKLSLCLNFAITSISSDNLYVTRSEQNTTLLYKAVKDSDTGEIKRYDFVLTIYYSSDSVYWDFFNTKLVLGFKMTHITYEISNYNNNEKQIDLKSIFERTGYFLGFSHDGEFMITYLLYKDIIEFKFLGINKFKIQYYCKVLLEHEFSLDLLYTSGYSFSISLGINRGFIVAAYPGISSEKQQKVNIVENNKKYLLITKIWQYRLDLYDRDLDFFINPFSTECKNILSAGNFSVSSNGQRVAVWNEVKQLSYLT